uniref:Uncharacterized protein n=1 Tax=Rousettus aegyptiacus TaxID=9407 RepID=A0A7J8GBJ7_ROUAE|nr:hypothetical protein HJG63_011625 [Rousettus aegyptiacus]
MQQLNLQDSPVPQSSNLHQRTVTVPHPTIQDNRDHIAPPHLLRCKQVTPMVLLFPLRVGHQLIPPPLLFPPCEKHHPRGSTLTDPLWFTRLVKELREEGGLRKQGNRLRRNFPPPAQIEDTILRQREWHLIGTTRF